MFAGRKKKRLIAGATAALSLIAVVFAAGAIITAHNTPEKTAEKLYAAMSEADFAGLAGIAVLASDERLTPEAAGPMFDLYSESASFRKSVKANLQSDIERIKDGSGPSPVKLFGLEEERNILYKKYRVVISPCNVNLTTNFVGASVTLGDKTEVSVQAPASGEDPQSGKGEVSADYANFRSAVASFSDLLPGRYNASVSFDTELGDTFSKTEEIDVFSLSASEDLAVPDCHRMTVYNYSDYDIAINAGKGEYRLPPGQELIIAPIAGDTQVTAGYKDTDGKTLEIRALPADSDYLCFELCELNVYNYNPVPLDIDVDGESFGSAESGGMLRVFPLQYNAAVSIKVQGCDFLAPFNYTVEYNSDTIYPTFALSDDALAVIRDYLTGEVMSCIAAFNARDYDTVKNYAVYDFGAQLYDMLTENAQDDTMTCELQDLNCYDSDYWYIGEDGVPVVRVDFDCDVGVKSEETGKYDTSGYFTVFLRYNDGKWELFAANNLEN